MIECSVAYFCTTVIYLFWYGNRGTLMLIVMMGMAISNGIHLCRLLLVYFPFTFSFTFYNLFNRSLSLFPSQRGRIYQILLMIMPFIAVQYSLCVSHNCWDKFIHIMSRLSIPSLAAGLKIEKYHIHDTFEIGMAQ